MPTGLSEIAEGLMKVTLAFRLCISAIGSIATTRDSFLPEVADCRLFTVTIPLQTLPVRTNVILNAFHLHPDTLLRSPINQCGVILEIVRSS